MPSGATLGAAAAGGIGVDHHPLVHAAFRVGQSDEGWQGEARGDGDGEVNYSVRRLSERLVLAAEKTSDAAKLGKVLANGGIRKGDGDASEANGGRRIAWSPAVDQGVAAGGPGDACFQLAEVQHVLLGGEESDPQEIGLRLRPDVFHIILVHLEALKEKIIPVLHISRRLDRLNINKDGVGGEGGHMMKGRILDPLCRGRLPTATAGAVSSRESVRCHFRAIQQRKRKSSLLWQKFGQGGGLG
jgi:hypothetical protein